MNPPEVPFEQDDARDAVLSSLLGASDDDSRLRAVLAAAAAAPGDGPQPGEAAALAAFRELVTEPAGVPSLAHRRRARLAVAAASSIVVVLGGGVAAAATGSLPDSAQRIAKTVLAQVGVHVPAPATTPGGDTKDNGSTPSPEPESSAPDATDSAAATPAAHPGQGSTSDNATAHPTHPAVPPTPGNSGPSRHHGNPTPTATGHPAPQHGKPTSPPLTSHRHSGATHTATPVMPVHPTAISR